ncbi:hypothetical protein ATK74_2913 [Propionicimonas paludicola]|uniref:Uncharacterized protein n=1 Tax=Propionicimonas paludicola TaxID=185243 RepID=A0A2A9CXM8_9ACTN|nr:hypothetical protein [Propionicimonas paludicola]PFG18329.1 hypothetical protein ATK74_2913 [Propionicimonas paludicola]
MKSARTGLTAALIALLVPAVLSGCSGAAAPANTSSAPTTSASSTSAAPSPSASQTSAAPTPSASTDGNILTPEQRLEMYVQAEKAQTDKVLEQSKGTYKKVVITSEAPGTIIFTYTFAKKLDRKVAKKYFDGMVSTLESVLDKNVYPAMNKVGVVDPKVRFVYLNSDSSKLWSHTFAPKA